MERSTRQVQPYSQPFFFLKITGERHIINIKCKGQVVAQQIHLRIQPMVMVMVPTRVWYQGLRINRTGVGTAGGVSEVYTVRNING